MCNIFFFPKDTDASNSKTDYTNKRVGKHKTEKKSVITRYILYYDFLYKEFHVYEEKKY